MSTLTQREEEICDTIDLFKGMFIVSYYEACLAKKQEWPTYDMDSAVKQIAKEYNTTPSKVREMVEINATHNFDNLLKKLGETV